MIFRILALAAVCFFAAGCQSVASLKIFEKDRFYDKSLRYTKSAQLIHTLETKVKISATYLNPIYAKEYGEGESFVVGLFMPEDFDKKELSGLSNPSVSLSMDKAKALKIVELDRSSSTLLRQIPNTDNWSRYYLVTFAKAADSKPMRLALGYAPYGEVFLEFSKTDEQ